MKKIDMIVKLKALCLNIIIFILANIAIIGIYIICMLHMIVPFFPILFLFDFCFLLGPPLFLRYVLKRKWSECIKDNYIKIIYILIPCLIMELAIFLYYPQEVLAAMDILLTK